MNRKRGFQKPGIEAGVGGPERAHSEPNAKAATSPKARLQIKRIAAERGLGGLANDTKWDELLVAMRSRMGQEWSPSFRYKTVRGYVSSWDTEWFCHLPFPLISIEWLDIAFRFEEQPHRLVPPKVIDESGWIEELVKKIGFDYRKGKSMIRIFGYAPRSLELFDE